MTHSSFALESLLLFQSVATHGATQQSFSRISNALRASDLLRQSTSDNEDRFDAQALTETYLRLLKAEAKTVTRQSPTKSPKSPKWASVEDASQHFHLVPGIIPKLYEQYKAEAIRDIRDDERRYDQGIKELQDAKDEAQAAEEAVVSRDSPASRPASSGKAKLDAILNEEDEPPLLEADAAPSTTQPEAVEQDPGTAAVIPADPQQPPDAQSRAIPVEQTAEEQAHTQPLQPSEPVAVLPPPQQQPARPLRPSDARVPLPHQQALETAHPTHSQPHIQQNGGFGVMYPPDASAHPRWIQSPYAAPQQGQTPSSPPRLQQQQQLPSMPTVKGEGHPRAFPQGSQLSAHQQAFRDGQHTFAQGNGQLSAAPSPLQPRGLSATISRLLGGPQSTPRASSNASPFTSHLIGQERGIHYSPGSSTGWRGPYTAEKDRPRSVSPVSDQEGPRTTAKRPGRRGRPKGLQLPRDAQNSGRGGRRVSKTPSMSATATSHGRTRSQSIVSVIDDASIASGPSTIRGAKSAMQTPTPGERLQTRHRRNQSSTQLSIKRKRRDSTADSFVTAEAPPSPSADQPPTPVADRPIQERPDFIIATRNFPRMTAPLMDNIASHKFASIFALPVPKKTAGYTDTVYRPTDLKTIRGQLMAGNRAIIAATAAGGGAGSPGGEGFETGATVSLPYSEEFEPPSAIVNADQLEQELMRMFANAAMFNEGDEGVVADTREMCEDVQRVIADFRGAEGGAGLLDLDDDGAGGGPSKRRRA